MRLTIQGILLVGAITALGSPAFCEETTATEPPVLMLEHLPGLPRLQMAPEGQSPVRSPLYMMVGAAQGIYPPNAALPQLAFGAQPFCTSGDAFCVKRKLSWFTLDLAAAIGRNLQITADGPSFQISKTIRLSIGHVDHFSNAPELFVSRNTKVALGRISFQLSHMNKPFAQSICAMGLTAPGYKHVEYEPSAVPFDGLSVVGVQQTCRMNIGPQVAQLVIGHAFSIDVDIGRSGKGEPNIQGEFGALNTDAKMIGLLGIVIRLPKNIQEMGMKGFEVIGTAQVQAHVGRGCTTTDKNGFFNCGNNIAAAAFSWGVMGGPLFEFN